jgi:hypothetical protein
MEGVGEKYSGRRAHVWQFIYALLRFMRPQQNNKTQNNLRLHETNIEIKMGSESQSEGASTASRCPELVSSLWTPFQDL